MSSLRLTRLDTGDFFRWVNRLGFRNEREFWTSLSGLSRGTVFDHMNHYLISLGYRGHPDDMVKQFLRDQITAQGGSISNLQTFYDLANCLYNLSFDVGTTHIVIDDSGNLVQDDSGNFVTD